MASGTGIAELSALSAVLLGIGNPLVATSLGGQISKHVAANQQGQIQGGNLALQTVGNVIGPILGGWMFERLGAQAPYLNAIVIILLGIMVIAPLLQRGQEPAGGAEAGVLVSE
jgi:predicted MFS family arabinose efflux permease